MLIAKALLAKIRPPRLNPREIQDQVDVTRAAVLTAAYAVGRQQQQHALGDETYQYDKLNKDVAALKPLARKLRVQTAINDQVSATPVAFPLCLIKSPTSCFVGMAHALYAPAADPLFACCCSSFIELKLDGRVFYCICKPHSSSTAVGQLRTSIVHMHVYIIE